MPQKMVLLRILPLYLMAAVLPFSISAGGVAAAIVLLVALIVLATDFQARRSCPASVFWVLLTMFVAYALSTALASPYSSHWHKWIEELWLKTILVTIPVVVGPYRSHVPRVLKLSLFMAFIVGIYAIWQHFSGMDLVRGRSLMTEFGHNEIVGFFGHKLSYGGQLLLYLLLGASLVLHTPERKQKVLWSSGLALLALAMLWSHARSPQLGVFFGALVLVFAVKGRSRKIGLALLPMPVLVALSIPSLREHLFRTFSHHRNVTRYNLWESSWEAIKARPVFGFGAGNFGSMMEKFEVEGFYNTRAHSHNDFLMHGVNGGVVGLLVALALLGLTTMLLWRLWKSGSSYAWVGLAGVSIQLGISVAGFFQVYQTDDEVEMLLYFILGCGLALGNSLKTDAKGEV